MNLRNKRPLLSMVNLAAASIFKHQFDIINFATVSQRFQEGFAIFIGQKDILPVITPVHHMVITIGQLDP